MRILVGLMCTTAILLLLLSGCDNADSSNKQESSNDESIVQTNNSSIKQYFDENTWENLNDKLEKLFKKDSVEISLSDKYESEIAQLEALGSGDLYFTAEDIDFKVEIKNHTSDEITFSINDSKHNDSGWHSNKFIYIFGESVENIKKDDNSTADGDRTTTTIGGIDYLGNVKRHTNDVGDKIVEEAERQVDEINNGATP